MTKAIKNVSDKTWREFKAMASVRGLSMGEMFEEMVEREKNIDVNCKKSLRTIFSLAENPMINEKEAERLRKISKEFRMDFKIRDLR